MSRARIDPAVPPGARPLSGWRPCRLQAAFEQALAAADGVVGAHCIHEYWMRGEPTERIEPALERLWKRAAASIPDWLPMRHIDWLGEVYAVAATFSGNARGASNVYLVLLDYRDRGAPYGIYVGMSHYSPAQRFDQHKAGIRAAGSVLKRGLEVLTGPTHHLQHIARAQAERIEAQLAEALRVRGLIVQGGH